MSEEATQSSLPAVGFSIATDESSTDNEGEEHKRVESLWNDRLRFAVFYLTYSAGGQSWLGLSEQEIRVDKWNICLVHAAAICGSQLK
jgi:hypothetical protein